MAKFGDKISVADIVQQEAQKQKVEFEKNSTMINGKKFKIKPLTADVGLDVFEFIVKTISPAIGVALDSSKHDSMLHGAPTTISDMALMLSAKLDGSTFSGLSDVMLKDMIVDGKVVDYREYFSANYGEWVQVFRFALEENFSTVFTQSGLLGQVAQIKNLVFGQPQPQE